MKLPIGIVGDIGGTHARFALLDEANMPQRLQVMAVADFAGPVEAMQAYLAASAIPTPSAAAIAIAAPVHDGVVALTNAAWSFSRESITARLGLRKLLLLNDFSALALSLPRLPAAELRQVGGGSPAPGAAKAVLGPGTGLGVSGLLHHGADWLPLSGEGGHCSLAPADAREAAILALAWREFEHVSAERLLSGSGLPLLHRLVADGRRPRTHVPLNTVEIVAGAVAGDDRQCCGDRHLLRDARLDGGKSGADPRRPGWRPCRRWYHSATGGNLRSLALSRPVRGQGALRFLSGHRSDLCNPFACTPPCWVLLMPWPTCEGCR
jgi:glucokinase